MRPIVTSVALGLIAGMVTALILTIMHELEVLIWPDDPSALRIALTIMVGGLLIAALRIRLPTDTFDSQLSDSREEQNLRPLRAAMLASLGIVSVAFGGAVGPEAGVLAVIAELSAMISKRIARDVQESVSFHPNQATRFRVNQAT